MNKLVKEYIFYIELLADQIENDLDISLTPSYNTIIEMLKEKYGVV